MNYLNRELITEINNLKTIATRLGMTVAQTNSRFCGKYLSAVRVYGAESDKGHAKRSIYTAKNLDEVRSIIADIGKQKHE